MGGATSASGAAPQPPPRPPVSAPAPGQPAYTFGAELENGDVTLQGEVDTFLDSLLEKTPKTKNVRIEPKVIPCGGPGVFAIACAVAGANEATERCEDPLDFEFAPTTISELDRFGNWTAPAHNSFIECGTTPAPPATFSEADFQALPITPSAIVVGPAGGWLPVRMVNIAYADATPQILTAMIVGQAVTVRATPTQFTWDWDDGTPPTTTTDPGHAWPDHTVAHPYTQAGDYTVTMTTLWAGELSLDGGATYAPIDGTATTTSTAPSISVTELRSRLVDDLVY